MSEYQYYEWQTIDRLLSEEEQAAVSDLSSHIEVSSSSAVVTYAWGDFKHNPRNVLARFFDAHLYMANWGSRRLMFRFPAGLLSREAIEPYCVDDLIMFEALDGFDVLDIELNEENGQGGDCEGSLSGLLTLRNDIIQGDHRCLYLAWLKAISLCGYEPSRGRKSTAAKSLAPPIPPGLKQLSPALKRFLKQFDVPLSLVDAASEVSSELEETAETDFGPLVARLSREKCDAFLCRVAQGDTTAGMELKQQLLSLVPRQPVKQAISRTIGELLNRAETIENARKRRQKEEARKKHVADKEREMIKWLPSGRRHCTAIPILV